MRPRKMLLRLWAGDPFETMEVESVSRPECLRLLLLSGGQIFGGMVKKYLIVPGIDRYEVRG